MPDRTERRATRRGPARTSANPLGDQDFVDYKDVALLRTFVSDKGKIRSRRVTRVTARQQRLVASAIANAREMALLPYPSTLRAGRP
ncbi:30S ribosomal protein S18 [Nocardiopsis sp. CT-R113]|uniref:Small ribosomal subunit protein bS18 n=1 Tax=Nocardiopsis codii TaxID=3065942 RepID=A0ABU7K7A8_9ACTN|nr:30S ribosomal protein S18 [Nocardiopsis sp. CT-R113]MEE2037422.1 30S ribosomal protein S18 [Nocardiopsis sp. CT-R113]